jgi:hypothetical protein
VRRAEGPDFTTIAPEASYFPKSTQGYASGGYSF